MCSFARTGSKVATIAILCIIRLAAQQPVASLPQYFIDRTFNVPTGGCIWTEGASNATCVANAGTFQNSTSGFQFAVANATPGDVIVVSSGTNKSGGATGFACNPGQTTDSVGYGPTIYFPYKANPSRKYIYVIASDFYNNPTLYPPGTRIDPEMYPSQQSHLATFTENSNTAAMFCFGPGVNYWRLVGIEVKCGSTIGPNRWSLGTCGSLVYSSGFGETGNRSVSLAIGGTTYSQGEMFKIDSNQPRCSISGASNADAALGVRPVSFAGGTSGNTLYINCQNMFLTSALVTPTIIIGGRGFYNNMPDVYYENDLANPAPLTITAYAITSGTGIAGSNLATLTVNNTLVNGQGTVTKGDTVYVAGMATTALNGTHQILSSNATTITFTTALPVASGADSGTVAKTGLYGNLTVIDDNNATINVNASPCNGAGDACSGIHWVRVRSQLPAGKGLCLSSDCWNEALVEEPLLITGQESITSFCNNAFTGGCSPVITMANGGTLSSNFTVTGSGTHWKTPLPGFAAIPVIAVDNAATLSNIVVVDDTHITGSWSVNGTIGKLAPGARTIDVTMNPASGINTFPGDKFYSAVHLASWTLTGNNAPVVVLCQTATCASTSEYNCYISGIFPNHGQQGTTHLVAITIAESFPGQTNCIALTSGMTVSLNLTPNGPTIDTVNTVSSNAQITATVVSIGGQTGTPCGALGYTPSSTYCANVSLVLDPILGNGANNIILSQDYVHGSYGTILNCRNSAMDWTLALDPTGTTSPTCHNETGSTIVVPNGSSGQSQVIGPGMWFTTNAEEVANGIWFGSDHSAIVDTTISQIGREAQESHGIIFSQSLGGTAFCNNRIDAATENFFVGGTWSLVQYSYVTPRDIIFGDGTGLLDPACRGNYVVKPVYEFPLAGSSGLGSLGSIYNQGSNVSLTAMDGSGMVTTGGPLLVTSANSFQSVAPNSNCATDAQCMHVIFSGITDPNYTFLNCGTQCKVYTVIAAANNPTQYTVTVSHTAISTPCTTGCSGAFAVPVQTWGTVESKNNFEFKNGSAMLANGNVFDGLTYGAQYSSQVITPRVGGNEGGLSAQTTDINFVNNLKWLVSASLDTFLQDNYGQGGNVTNGMEWGSFVDRWNQSNNLAVIIPSNGFVNGVAPNRMGHAGGNNAPVRSTFFDQQQQNILIDHDQLSLLPDPSATSHTQSLFWDKKGATVPNYSPSTNNFWVIDSVYEWPFFINAEVCCGSSSIQFAMNFPQFPECTTGQRDNRLLRFGGNVIAALGANAAYPSCSGINPNTSLSARSGLTPSYTTPVLNAGGTLQASSGLTLNFQVSNATWQGNTHDGSNPGVNMTILNGAIANVISGQTACGSAPIITTPVKLPLTAIGEVFNVTFAAACGVPPYGNWTMTPTPISGMSLSVSGTLGTLPTTAGIFNPSITVSDSTPTTSSPTTFILTVNPRLTITSTSLPSWPVNTSGYSACLAVSGGVQPFFFQTILGSLPPGIILNAASGCLTGTPTAVGSYTVTYQVEDQCIAAGVTPCTGISDCLGADAVACAILTITINSGTLNVLTTSLPNTSVGATYPNTQAQASGGVTPYSWALDSTSGPWPGGITMNSAGIISSTPTVTGPAGTYPIVLRVTDSTSGTPLTALSGTLFLSVTTGLSNTTTVLNSCTVGLPYSSPLTATGGVTPYTWSIIGGSLPTGIFISGQSLSGMSQQFGIFNPVLQVTDSESPPATSSTPVLTLNCQGNTGSQMAPGVQVSPGAKVSH